MELAIVTANIWGLWFWPVLGLLAGLGLVIFMHELGHFLVAKAVGIKVERFSLGFGPKLFGVTRGETQYWVSALPLGGYVKMLGQEDFKPQDGEQADPRAFNNKSVGARLAVVSAGVIMNVILAAILFVVVGLIGIGFPANVVGSVRPDFPAAKAEITWQSPDGALAATQAASAPAAASRAATATSSTSSPASGPATSIGLEPGDRIIDINGKPITSWRGIFVKAALAKKDDVFHVTFERQTDGVIRRGVAAMGVKATNGETEGKNLAFGITPAPDMVLGLPTDTIIHTPIKDGDRLVAVNGQKVRHFWELAPIFKADPYKPAKLTFQRDGETFDMTVQPRVTGGKLVVDGKSVYATVVGQTDDKLQIKYPDGRTELQPLNKVQDDRLEILGLVPRLRVWGVMDGSPAQVAGIEPGDVIVNYGGLGAPPTYNELMDINANVVGQGADIVVQRDGKTLDAVKIVPHNDKGRAVVGLINEMDAAPVVAQVRADAPSAGKILRNDVIEKVNGQPVSSWLDIYVRLKELPADQDVVLTVKRNTLSEDVNVGTLGQQAFDPSRYEVRVLNGAEPAEVVAVPALGGAGFKPLMVQIQKTNPLDAIAWGVRETTDWTLDNYVSLRALLLGTISHKELRGPLGIGSLAIQAARTSLATLIYFMAIISISLAVINFLPIPVVDGGHVLMLTIEKIMGKPVSPRIMNVAQIIGLVLLLGLLLLASWNDISRFIKGMW